MIPGMLNVLIIGQRAKGDVEKISTEMVNAVKMKRGKMNYFINRSPFDTKKVVFYMNRTPDR
jgi:hypothetical protein